MQDLLGKALRATLLDGGSKLFLRFFRIFFNDLQEFFRKSSEK
jgi:hypothetical protein